jgi:hypothetical protein
MKTFVVLFLAATISLSNCRVRKEKIIKDEVIFDVEEEELCPPKRIKDREAARFNTDD